MFGKERAILFATLTFLISDYSDCASISIHGIDYESGSTKWTHSSSSLLLRCNTKISNPTEICWFVDGVKQVAAASSQIQLEFVLQRTLGTQIVMCTVQNSNNYFSNATITFKSIVPVHNVSALFFPTNKTKVRHELGYRVQMICHANVEENVSYEWSVKYPGTNSWNFASNTKFFEDIIIEELEPGLTEYRCKASNAANIDLNSEKRSNEIYVINEDSSGTRIKNLCGITVDSHIRPKETSTYPERSHPVENSDDDFRQHDSISSREDFDTIFAVVGTLTAIIIIIGIVYAARQRQRRRQENALPMKPCAVPTSQVSTVARNKGTKFADVENDTENTYIDLLPDAYGTLKLFSRPQMPLPRHVDKSQFEENIDDSDHTYERISE